MSTDQWVVEPMDAASDLAAVREVDRNSFPHPWTAEMFQRELERRDISHVFVIRTRDAAVIGYCAVWVVVDELHINNLVLCV